MRMTSGFNFSAAANNAWPSSTLPASDYPLVTGLVMTYTVAFVIINLIIDGLYAVVDPRIRY